MLKTIRASWKPRIRGIEKLQTETCGTFDWNNGTVNEIHAAIVPLFHDLIVPLFHFLKQLGTHAWTPGQNRSNSMSFSYCFIPPEN